MVLNPTAGFLEHKTCLGCRYVKGKVLVTGHARNQEVEELFRVLVIGFVGLQYPKTANHGGIHGAISIGLPVFANLVSGLGQHQPRRAEA